MFNRLSIIFLSGVFIFGISTLAYADQEPSFVHCSSEIEDLLDTLNSQNSWRLAYKNTEKAVFLSPTYTVGLWISLTQLKNQLVELRLTSKQEVELYEIDQNCQINQSELNDFTPSESFSNADFDHFTDYDLIEALESNKNGVVYLWSPRFIYSVNHYLEAKETVESLGLSFTGVMRSTDDDLGFLERNSDYILETLPETVILNQSLELEMRGLGLHSPSFLIYKDGQILADIIVGVHTRQSLRQQLRSLR